MTEIEPRIRQELEQQIDLETVKSYYNSGFHPQISFIINTKKVVLNSDELNSIIDSIKVIQSLMPMISYEGKIGKLVFETLMLHEDRNSFNSTGLNNFFFSDKEIGFPRGVIVLELISNQFPKPGDLLEDLVDFIKSNGEEKVSQCFKIRMK